MRRLAVRPLPLCALLITAIVSGCSSDSSTGPVVTIAEIVGTYDLAKLSSGGTAVPGATGDLTLTAGSTANTGTYVLDLTEPALGGGDMTIADNGTFTINGSNWSQTGETTGTQSGTVSFANDTLTVNVTANAIEVTTRWAKQVPGRPF
jgi:hypothetical protein